MEEDVQESPPTKKLATLDAPVEVLESQSEIREVSARFQRRRISLEMEDESLLIAHLKRVIADVEDGRASLIQKCRDLNDLYEGVTTITDTPWPGASSLHIPIPKIKAREIRSVIMRSTMRPIPFLLTKYAGPDSLYDSTKDFVKTVESFLEDKIKNDTNVHETLTEAIIPTIRDGTCPIQVTWETDVETVVDYKTYAKMDDFITDYPTAESAGVSEERYNKILEKIANGDPYDVKFEYEVVNYDGPRANIVQLVDFVHWPIFVPRIEDLPCVGKRVYYTDDKLQDMVTLKKFKQDDVDAIVRGGGDERRDNFTTSRDNIEGITRSFGKTQEHEIYELCVKFALTEADRKSHTRRKYLVYFHARSGKLLYVTDYPIRRGKPNFFVLRLVRRDGRLLGMSLIDDISDLSMEIDILHRQRTNSRTISHVPSFKAKEAAKGRFDPASRQYRFRPGVVFWLTNLDDVQQFDIRPVDLSGSVEEEMMLYQLIDMVTGSTSANSGALQPLDPRAPARKQQEMLRQSSNRIDDYVESLLPVFGKVGSFMLDLYYQYGPDRIKYYATTEDGKMVQSQLDRQKLYEPNVMLVVNGTSVYESPDQEYQRAIEIDQVIAMNPTTAQNPKIRRNSLGRILSASRTQDYKALMPPDETVQPILDPATGLIKTQDQKDQEAQAALAKQKLASKVGQEDKRHEEKRAAIAHDGIIQSEILHQKLQGDLALRSVDQAHTISQAPQQGV